MTPDIEKPKLKKPPPQTAMRITSNELSTAALSPTCIVKNYLFCDVATLAAPGGTGKTTQVLYELICIALARPLYGLNVLRPGWSLYVTAEDSRGILIARLREIMRAMGLTAAEQQTVMDRVLIWDCTGEATKLISARDGNIEMTNLPNEIIEAYRTDPPVMMIFDPIVSFGAGEAYVNDNEQGLIVAARKIIRGLGCCVRMVAHTGKVNARGKTLDQYTSRGGSALSDGARMVAVLQAFQPGDARKLPQGCVHTQGASITVLARPKLSYAPANQPLIWIRRTGWTFEYFTDVPIDDASRGAAILDQVERFLASEVAKGHRHNVTSLEGAIPSLKRAETRNAIAQLMARGRISEIDLPPKERRGRRKTCLATSAEYGGIGKNHQPSKGGKTSLNYAAALREKDGGVIAPPSIPVFSDSAGDAWRNTAELAELDQNLDDEALI